MGRRRPKYHPSKLVEYFPNEIFAQIFSYLNGVEAVVAFADLNHRFQCLLLEYCPYFDLQSISKRQFELIARFHDTRRWKSLRISDDDHTPGHVEYFCRFYSLMKDFPQLQSLAIVNLNLQGNFTILSQLPSLTNLVSLTIDAVCGGTMSSFDLPNLKRLVFASCTNLSWIQKFSHLESIEYTIQYCCSSQIDFIWPLTLKHLKILFFTDRDYDSILHSLVPLSSLLNLEVYQNNISYSHPNGQVWENLLRSSLPLLKIFKLYLQFQCSTSLANHQEVVASFSTPFFIRERKWIIYHDIPYRYPHHFIILNSLPFAFEQYLTLRKPLENSLATVPEDYSKDVFTNLYDNIQTLKIKYQNAEIGENFSKPSVINLTIYVDFDVVPWLHVLTRIRHLDLYFTASLSSKIFRLLLSNTSDLYSLSIGKTLLRTLTDNWNDSSICHHLSQKIRTLKLCSTTTRSHCLSRHELQQIMRIFGAKCEHLSLPISSPDETIGLILQNMSQLHSLHVTITQKNHSPIDMAWLEKQQTRFNHSNCMIVSGRDSYHFWL